MTAFEVRIAGESYRLFHQETPPVVYLIKVSEVNVWNPGATCYTLTPAICYALSSPRADGHLEVTPATKDGRIVHVRARNRQDRFVSKAQLRTTPLHHIGRALCYAGATDMRGNPIGWKSPPSRLLSDNVSSRYSLRLLRHDENPHGPLFPKCPLGTYSLNAHVTVGSNSAKRRAISGQFVSFAQLRPVNTSSALDRGKDLMEGYTESARTTYANENIGRVWTIVLLDNQKMEGCVYDAFHDTSGVMAPNFARIMDEGAACGPVPSAAVIHHWSFQSPADHPADIRCPTKPHWVYDCLPLVFPEFKAELSDLIKSKEERYSEGMKIFSHELMQLANEERKAMTRIILKAFAGLSQKLRRQRESRAFAMQLIPIPTQSKSTSHTEEIGGFSEVKENTWSFAGEAEVAAQRTHEESRLAGDKEPTLFQWCTSTPDRGDDALPHRYGLDVDTDSEE